MFDQPPRRPAYFVVQRRHGREEPMIFWDYLPREPLRYLDYVVRLDQLPNGETLVTWPLSTLYAMYCSLKHLGQLPPRWEPPARGKAEAKDA